ncbi:GntR family transcriptional regulator [Echinicola jeungdonensis]|uniref:GntR family transcriptional regulator n=1 Tax=Echinicola jeungdonensis TaxID=709343 RepID=A0ABV5J9E0_9BACT|nr:GntR family transcriptional regulator [Echinicola jeungdonensis]MDN3670455.1 GntR family transcriptional regulator [Echinicola jeungdonensis]
MMDFVRKFDIEIDEASRVPKYQQLVNRISSLIQTGTISKGAKLPSINEISEQLILSRDTVEKAYNLMKKEGWIIAIPARGFFVNEKKFQKQGGKILYMVNKLSPYKLEVFRTFQEALSLDYEIELKPFFFEPQLFMNKLGQSFDDYDYVVIVPIFNHDIERNISLNQAVLQYIERIPKEKLIVLEKNFPKISGKYTCIYQDFKKDVFTALSSAFDLIKKYEKVNLIYPDSRYSFYPPEIKQGFKKFCADFGFPYEVINISQLDKTFNRNQAYIVISEDDFLELMKKIKSHKLQLGNDIGLISYNDTPLKKLFNVTVLSTNFKQMGTYAAKCVAEKKTIRIKNDFRFIRRKSL